MDKFIAKKMKPKALFYRKNKIEKKGKNMIRFFKIFALIPLVAFSSINTPDAKMYYKKGIESLNSKEFIDAIGMFTNAISLKPDYADAYYYRGYAKDLLGKAMQFKNVEMCTDFVMAMKLGYTKAISKLENDCMGECQNLKMAQGAPDMTYCVNMSEQDISDIPSGMDKLDYVVKLDLSKNKLSSVNEITGMKGLISLDMSSNQLTSLPDDFSDLKYLKELDLSRNKIQGLPDDFGKLKHLHILNLKQNQLQTMPRSIANLSNLEILDLSFNQIKSIPLEIAGLKNLKKLNLMGTDVPDSEKTKLMALLPNVEITFDEY